MTQSHGTQVVSRATEPLKEHVISPVRARHSIKVLVPVLIGLFVLEAVVALFGFTGRPAVRAAAVKTATPVPRPAPVLVETVKAAPTHPKVEVVSHPVAAPRPMAKAAPQPTAAPTNGYGCASALSYLSTHSAPGYSFVCPGYAEGHQAMTCTNDSSACPGAKVIVIADPCPAAYMNEAHNSWVTSGLESGTIDPYGSCH